MQARAQGPSPDSGSFQAMNWRSKKRRKQAVRPAQVDAESEAAAQAALRALAFPTHHSPRCRCCDAPCPSRDALSAKSVSLFVVLQHLACSMQLWWLC